MTNTTTHEKDFDVTSLADARPKSPQGRGSSDRCSVTGSAEIDHEFEIWQDGMPVASAMAQDRNTALREAMHYAAVYGQDGPVEIVEVTRRSVSNEHPKGEDTNVAECAACQCGPEGETPVLPPPVSAGELGELIEELYRFEGSDALGNGDFSVCARSAQALQSLQQKLKEAEARHQNELADSDEALKDTIRQNLALHFTVEQMAKALEEAEKAKDILQRLVSAKDVWTDYGSGFRIHFSFAPFTDMQIVTDVISARSLLSKGSEQSTGQGKGEE